MLIKVIEIAGPINRMRLVKIMFLLSRDPFLSKHHPTYKFVPYKFGPFSFEMYHNLAGLRSRGYLSEQGEVIACIKGAGEKLDERVVAFVKHTVRSLDDIDDRELVESIYEEYPELTIFSEITKKKEYRRDETGISSIGYQDRTIDEFLAVLIDQKVQMVLDVRKNPVSMKYPFSKRKLTEILSKFDIEYRHVPELGVDGEDRKSLRTYEDYQALFKRYQTRLGDDNPFIDEIIRQGGKRKLALMCYERDPVYCHRGVISEAIRSRGLEVIDV